MKLVAFAAVLATFLPGCILGCSGYSGGGDRVFARGSDQLIVCENDGFIATTATGTIEGQLVASGATTAAVEGDDGQTIFTLEYPSDDTADTAGFGSAWTEVDENTVQLDHANVLCTDLTTQPWWSNGTGSAS